MDLAIQVYLDPAVAGIATACMTGALLAFIAMLVWLFSGK